MLWPVELLLLLRCLQRGERIKFYPRAVRVKHTFIMITISDDIVKKMQGFCLNILKYIIMVRHVTYRPTCLTLSSLNLPVYRSHLHPLQTANYCRNSRLVKMSDLKWVTNALLLKQLDDDNFSFRFLDKSFFRDAK